MALLRGVEPDIARAMRIARSSFAGDDALDAEIAAVLAELDGDGMPALLSGFAAVVGFFAHGVAPDNPTLALEVIERSWTVMRAEIIVDHAAENRTS